MVLPRAENTSQTFYSMFYLGEGMASGKHVLQSAEQSAQTDDNVTERRPNKMAEFSIRRSLLFFRLTFLRQFQTHCDSSREKQFILALGT